MGNVLEGEGISAEESIQERTASEVIAAELVEAGVKYVFGIPGHTCLGVVEAIRKHKDIDFVTVRHEETAALMASAYAKISDKLGVVLTIAGPGATNLMTGLYDAKMDHAPVLALTGQVDLQFIGRDVLQEIDQNALFEPVSLFNKVITTADETAEVMLLAIKNALVRRGVAHLGVPTNTQRTKTAQPVRPFKGRIPSLRIRPSEEQCKKAASKIDSANRPVVILGWGARFATDDCLELAEKIGAPITTTFKAKGIVSELGPQSIGVHGSVGIDPSKELVRDSDLLIVLGSSFSAQTAIPSDKPIIQVDYDAMVLGKRFPVEFPLWGSVEDTVPLLKRLVKRRSNEPTVQKIKSLMEKWDKKIQPTLSTDETPIHPARVLRALQKEIPEEAMISIDAGDNSWWFGKYFKMSRQKFILSGYLATMAFGFAGALGASFAYPSMKSVAITGDGAFSMVMADFTTAVKYHLPLVAIVYDNSELSMITHEQASEGFPKYATELVNPNFADFAESCGGEGYDVRRPEELESVLDQAMDSRKPCVVNVHTNPAKFWMAEH